jgi:hypothetical protein
MIQKTVANKDKLQDTKIKKQLSKNQMIKIYLLHFDRNDLQFLLFFLNSKF